MTVIVAYMKSFYALENTVKSYSWGHSRSIPDFLGWTDHDGSPVAELWMGAHPSSPSILAGENQPLHEAIAGSPADWLGSDVRDAYGRLPYLYKLLAAGQSLSIQAHPDKAAAEEGFAREERNGMPLSHPRRNYKDDNHKPEILMALTPFSGMIGFRQPSAILAAFEELEVGLPAFMASLAGKLKSNDADALKPFLRGLLTLEGGEKDQLLESALKNTSRSAESSCWDELQRLWVPRLAQQFPADIGALSPLFLNLVTIAPGEALYQPARVLHAYLDGFGVELMANSDNVLRGGLTPKNVDVDELTSVLDFEPSVPEVLKPRETRTGGLTTFQIPTREFSLSLAAAGEDTFIPEGFGPAIVLCIEGQVTLSDDTETLTLQRGESAMIPWKAPRIALKGHGRAALAGVGR